MPSKEFSRAILEGLGRDGMSLRQIARMTGVSAEKLKLIQQERAAFTHPQLDRIEEATQCTVGQWSVRTLVGKQHQPIRDLMDAWANVIEVGIPKSRRKPKRVPRTSRAA